MLWSIGAKGWNHGRGEAVPGDDVEGGDTPVDIRFSPRCGSLDKTVGGYCFGVSGLSSRFHNASSSEMSLARIHGSGNEAEQPRIEMSSWSA